MRPKRRAARRCRRRRAKLQAAILAARKGTRGWSGRVGGGTGRADGADVAQTHVLEIADFDSAAGSAHRVLDDRSVLLSDDNVPDKDTYTVTVRTALTGITGFKIEALTDPSLPGQGPGRGDATRPNFVLNEFAVTAAPAGGASEPARVQILPGDRVVFAEEFPRRGTARRGRRQAKAAGRSIRSSTSRTGRCSPARSRSASPAERR